MDETRSAGDRPVHPREMILSATRDLMIERGYAAVSTRKVAARAGVKPALVQHYFRKMDDLLLAVYRHAAERAIERQTQALAAPRPLSALWRVSRDAGQTVLALEFMALASHRASIRSEIMLFQERARALHARAVAAVLARRPEGAGEHDATGLAALLVGAAHALVMEANLGFTTGHDAAGLLAERLIRDLEGDDPA